MTEKDPHQTALQVIKKLERDGFPARFPFLPLNFVFVGQV